MYTIVNPPEESIHWARILISYNKESEKFSVTSADTQCGYFVSRSDLIGDFRNFYEVLNQILDGCNQPALTLIDETAQKEINLIWEANVVLF